MSAQISEHDLRQLHRELLQPTFPEDELLTEEDFVDGCLAGTIQLHVERDGGRPIALVAAEFHPQSRVLLVDYLAVEPSARGGGIGGRALTAALKTWQQEFGPRLVLAEVEHPSTPAREAAHGDPVARVAFYARLGARALPLPYAQPPLRPGGRAVDGLMLVVLREDGRAPDHEVAASPVRDFLRQHLPSGDDCRRALDRIDGHVLPTIELTEPASKLPSPPRR